jgi:hypothetical protein
MLALAGGGDLLFQFGKAGQTSEQLSLNEAGRFGMASRGHAKRYQSVRRRKACAESGNTSSVLRPLSPSDAEKEFFLGRSPRVALTLC